jgi:hypothetical protein
MPQCQIRFYEASGNRSVAGCTGTATVKVMVGAHRAKVSPEEKLACSYCAERLGLAGRIVGDLPSGQGQDSPPTSWRWRWLS